MVGVVVLVRAGVSESTPLIRLLASVMSGALAYLGMMRLVDRAAIVELRGLLAR